jgi:Ca2+-binding RTX toxin-like protein
LYGPATVQVCVGPCGTLAAPIVVGVLSGSAVVLGTSAADHIRATAVSSTVVDISTYGTTINATTGCVLVWNGHAWCTAATYADINGGPGNDVLTIEGSLRARLQGQYGDDTLTGGSGADVFYGGPGYDTVDYSARAGQTITGTPGTGYDDGRPGEGDNIMADVERVVLP